MSKEVILIIEDDENILELIRYNLAREGYGVVGVVSGEEGMKIIKSSPPDLIVLDLMLPGMDGLEFCRLARNNPSAAGVPIVMVTAKGEEADIVAGLELGADDYITKPFSPRVLIARVRAVLRRRRKEEVIGDAPLKVGELFIHPGRHEILIKGRGIDLTHTEFQILLHLARHPGWVFTRYQIVNAVKGDDYPVTDRSVDVQVAGLRKKLGEYGDLIETVRGVGYRFRAEL
jgi:two-component system alkaline phosphatase synthesis response regulator PhoP